MPFNSYEFVFAFLPLTVAGFWLLARFAGRNAAMGWLILASVAFYASASLAGLVIIAPSILLDYLLATALLRSDPSRHRLRTVLFTAGVAANVALLGYFKYKNFFLDTANTLLTTHFELTRVILPLGISFLVFQKIAFLGDVQAGQLKTVRFLDFILFTLFFPRTIAGPIIHYAEVMPQLAHIKPRGISVNIAVAVCLFSIGFFKKTVIADSIAPFVPPTFEPVENQFTGGAPTLLTSWTGVLAYTFQLYFDFSGYSDMALGLARMFGVRLPMNFNSPFKASSIVEFWARWHITLTRFLTAYVYTPIVLRLTRARMANGKAILRGKRSTFPAIGVLIALPTVITMTISGLWHGAGWQFIVWGMLHGVYLTINQGWRILRPRFWSDQSSYERLMKPLGFVLTFGAVVTALVFFRATSIGSALSILQGMTGANGILPRDAQLLQSLGVVLPWSILTAIQPVAPFVWIIVLFLAVTRLPNSLELLRKHRPALDFPAEDSPAETEQPPEPGVVHQPARPKKASAAAVLRAGRVAIHRIAEEGLSLGGLTATIAALLFVLGVMALGRGGAFLYGQF